jgi:hypothetical protein
MKLAFVDNPSHRCVVAFVFFRKKENCDTADRVDHEARTRKPVNNDSATAGRLLLHFRGACDVPVLMGALMLLSTALEHPSRIGARSQSGILTRLSEYVFAARADSLRYKKNVCSRARSNRA